MTNLPYGLNPLPDGVETAWGARWIVKADGMVDPVFDRMAAVGDLDKRRALLDHLNDHAGTKPQERARDLLRGYPDTGHLDEPRLSTRSESVVTLWEDEEVIVQASPNASGGYLYVRAYYKADVQTEAFTGKQCYGQRNADGNPLIQPRPDAGDCTLIATTTWQWSGNRELDACPDHGALLKVYGWEQTSGEPVPDQPKLRADLIRHGFLKQPEVPEGPYVIVEYDTSRHSYRAVRFDADTGRWSVGGAERTAEQVREVWEDGATWRLFARVPQPADDLFVWDGEACEYDYADPWRLLTPEQQVALLAPAKEAATT